MQTIQIIKLSTRHCLFTIILEGNTFFLTGLCKYNNKPYLIYQKFLKSKKLKVYQLLFHPFFSDYIETTGFYMKLSSLLLIPSEIPELNHQPSNLVIQLWYFESRQEALLHLGNAVALRPTLRFASNLYLYLWMQYKQVKRTSVSQS